MSTMLSKSGLVGEKNTNLKRNHCGDDESINGVKKRKSNEIEQSGSSESVRRKNPKRRGRPPEKVSLGNACNADGSNLSTDSQTSSPAAAVEPLCSPNEAATATMATAHTNNAHQVILTIHSELENLGKALACPLCLHALRDSTLLPCLHAFCMGCLNTAFSPTDYSSKKRRKNSPPPLNRCCPVCKLKCGRRSMVRSEQLDDLVKGYKMTLRAFGLTPVVYGAGVQMTQLDPEEADGGDDNDGDDNDDRDEGASDGEHEFTKGRSAKLSCKPEQRLDGASAVESKSNVSPQTNHPAEASASTNPDSDTTARQSIVVEAKYKQKKPDAIECHEHLQVTRAVRDAFANAQHLQVDTEVSPAATASSRAVIQGSRSRSAVPPPSSKEEFEKRVLAQKYRLLVQEQEAVVKIDEEALEKVKRGKKRKMEGRPIENTLIFDEEGGANPGSGSTAPSEKLRGQHQAMNKINEAGCVSFLEQMESEEYCTAGESEEYCTAPEEHVTESSPVVIHNRDTTKKTKDAFTPKRLNLGEPESHTNDNADDNIRTLHEKNDNTDENLSNGSPIIVHDGNTVRKNRIPQHRTDKLNDIKKNHRQTQPTSQAMTTSPGQATSESGATKEPPPKQKAQDHNDHGQNEDADFASDRNYIPDEHAQSFPQPKKFFGSADSESIGRLRSNLPLGTHSVPGTSSREISQYPDESKEIIKKNTIVFVQARTWPGINKPGGVARVLKVHPASENTGPSTKYDVAYVLGGREKGVDDSFVSLHTVTSPSDRNNANEDLKGGSKAESDMGDKKKLRLTRQRKMMNEAKPLIKKEIPAYKDEDLQHIPPEVLQWAGILPKEKNGKVAKKRRAIVSDESKGKAKVTPTTNRKGDLSKSTDIPRHNSSTMTKDVKQKGKIVVATKNSAGSTKQEKCLINTRTNINVDTSKGIRKNTKYKGSPKQANPAEAAANVTMIPCGGVIETIGAMSLDKIIHNADERYHLLFSPQTLGSSAPTINIVTSSLSRKESETAERLCKILKSNEAATIKIMKDFHPKKTQLCITSAVSPPKKSSVLASVDVLSKSRTLKVMRAALLGIPILTSEWMDACLRQGDLVTPTEGMLVRTMPRKLSAETNKGSEENKSESFGVTKYSAAFHHLDNRNGEKMAMKHLLSGVSVWLCGSWKTTGTGMKKDLKLLLQETDATIINSVSAATQALSKMAKGTSSSTLFIFLCDDSRTDKDCGISEAVFDEAKRVIESKNSFMMAVHFSWLFDSISCATLMAPQTYEPLAPKSKALWCLGCRGSGNTC